MSPHSLHQCSTTADYFRVWADAEINDPHRLSRPNRQFPSRLKQVANDISSQCSSPFTLFHPDFGYYNNGFPDDYSTRRGSNNNNSKRPSMTYRPCKHTKTPTLSHAPPSFTSQHSMSSIVNIINLDRDSFN